MHTVLYNVRNEKDQNAVENVALPSQNVQSVVSYVVSKHVWIYDRNRHTLRGEEYDKMSDPTNLQEILSALKNSKKLQHWDKPPRDFGPDNPEVGMGG